MVRFTDDGGEQLAPVIPLFGAAATPAPGTDDETEADAAPTEPTRGRGTVRALPVVTTPDDPDAETEAGLETDPGAETEPDEDAVAQQLLRRLARRSLSLSEARSVLIDAGLDHAARERILDDFLRRRYLDDAALADQLVRVGSERKGQGRRAIARTLAQRGVPRDIADEALSVLADDDRERALEHARSKASSLLRLDRDVALRRLVGQLARRGYPGSVARDAAVTALDEAAGGAGPRRPSFS